MLSAVRAARLHVRRCRSLCSSARRAGYQQANVVILPSHLADDFEAFCHRNPAPLPLLYRSQSGETSCPPLAKHADIRTDIPQYRVYEDGHLVKTVSSLQLRPGSDLVCFYLGCSFGFEGSLKKAGVPVRNMEQGSNVSMFRVPLTSITTQPQQTCDSHACHLRQR